ncbi:G patch domain and ankyrin repeat-containing protein 1-like [Leucoraja erinacea]|uniref:G patch domain and ankyrin repeat-containing protein 1-like n=1 Tax=Leucoraja erinaceus TaxID=7782 RepID=UPI002458DA1E|nr:G patch domain and ankyrin repeat-containing protein 1-like [Leucoraja erinacea]
MSCRQLISFTRAVEDGDAWRDGERRVPCSPLPRGGGLDGEQARSFYESVLASSSQASTSSRASTNSSAVRKHKAEWRGVRAGGPSGHQVEGGQRNGHLLLKSAQNGDLKMLRRLLETGVSDINFRDSYYWTATMCAAYSGQLEAVRYLLSLGAAWVGVCDCTGRDALDLARQAGHAEIVTTLEEYHTPEEQEDRRERPEEGRRKLCQVCELEYREDSVQQHERSTLHLVSKGNTPAPTHYSIPDTNVGFRMMLREGWDRERGLGPCGKGRKFPVSTVLKRDQRGLGFQRGPRPKVTHFQARDPEAVQQPRGAPGRVHRVATVSRREERRREARGREWERDLRVYMDL